jgi:hypothetical protein
LRGRTSLFIVSLPLALNGTADNQDH